MIHFLNVHCTCIQSYTIIYKCILIRFFKFTAYLGSHFDNHCRKEIVNLMYIYQNQTRFKIVFNRGVISICILSDKWIDHMWAKNRIYIYLYIQICLQKKGWKSMVFSLWSAITLIYAIFRFLYIFACFCLFCMFLASHYVGFFFYCPVFFLIFAH